MDAIQIIFYIAILLMSVVIHEISHGFMAERWGDRTARMAGRLTLNPLKHLDLFGSIILPALLILSRSPFFVGWAKPVPYNPDNLSNRRWGELSVAAAGILANLLVAGVFSLLIRAAIYYNWNVPAGFGDITSLIVLVNISLAIFNLVPIPPLDGSKILYSLLPESLQEAYRVLEQWSFILIIIFIIYFSSYLSPIMLAMFKAFTGMPIAF